MALLQQHAQGQGGDQRAHIALEKVRAHAGHVAHVVAHVVGDDSGVAGVVLGDARLHLAHQVRAHVGGLGVDAAAHTGEQGDGGSAQGEAEEDVVILGEDVDETAAQQAQAHHAHAHDGAAGKSHGQGPVHAGILGGRRGADIGPGGDLHAEEARQDGEQRADHEADGGAPVDEQPDQHKQRGDEDGKDSVLGLQEGVGPFRDGGSDLAHALRAGGSLQNIAGLVKREQKGRQGKNRNYPYVNFHRR